MSSEKTFRVALAGCGRISKNHFEAIHEIDGLELVAVCDTDPERAARAGAEWKVPHFTSYEKMLKDAKADVITIATPSGLHADQGVEAAQAGKHVVMEKPMAISLTGADALVHACDKARVQLFVVKQNRLNPPIQLLKHAIDRNRFGRIYLASCTVHWARPQEYYDQASWRGTWEFDGGAFMNQASHYVDLIQWLVGPVESVMAKTATGLSYFGLCLALVQKKFKPAIELCKRAIELQFYNGDHYANLSRVYAAAGNRKKALETVQTGLKLLPEHESLREVRRTLGVRSRLLLHRQQIDALLVSIAQHPRGP